jgi:hypothetical protein
VSASIFAAYFITRSESQSASGGPTVVGGSYAINGLTCTYPDGYPQGTSAGVASLVSSVTQGTRFQAETNGSIFVLGYAGNITGRSEIVGGKMQTGPGQNGSVVGGTTVYLPNVIELVFYSYGSATTCDGGRGDYISIDVQIPIQDNRYNTTGMQMSTGRGPYG